jgi:hypothetical protein
MRKTLTGLAVLVAAFACLAVLMPSVSTAGTYQFRDCEYTYQWSGDLLVHESPASGFETNNPEATCKRLPGFPDVWMGLRGNSQTLNSGNAASFRWVTPPGSGFAGVAGIDYRLGSRNGIQATVQLNNSNGSNPVVIDTPSSMAGTRTGYGVASMLPAGQTRTVLRGLLRCNQSSCNGSASAFVNLGNIYAVINDFTNPVAVMGPGSLISSGPVSGTRSLEIAAIDGQSGVRLLYTLINSSVGSLDLQTCAATYTRIRPCPSSVQKTVSFNTAQAPFVEGANSLRVCAADYADSGSANIHCTDPWTVTVDN